MSAETVVLSMSQDPFLNSCGCGRMYFLEVVEFMVAWFYGWKQGAIKRFSLGDRNNKKKISLQTIILIAIWRVGERVKSEGTPRGWPSKGEMCGRHKSREWQ